MNVETIKSITLGHAVGDALGVPVEFADREELEKKPVADMLGFGTYMVPAGSWSDDTSMSLCTLAALCRRGWSYEDVMKNFAEWLFKNKFTSTGETFDVGRTCWNAIINYAQNGKPLDKCGLSDELSNGNGSLMRIYPFVLAAYQKENFDEIIEKGSALTHAHPRSVLACQIYAYVLVALLNERSKGSVIYALRKATIKFACNPEIKEFLRLTADFEKTPINDIKSSGYVVDTLEAAIWCLLTTDNYKDCVLKAVNLGGDTDTVAAVAGSLAGLLYGYGAIPKEWLSVLKKRDAIEKVCQIVAQHL